MPRTGFLNYVAGESQLDGLLLAIEGASNPLTAATTYLMNNGFANNQRIRVTGRDDNLGNVPVYYMTGVQPAPLDAAPATVNLGAAAKELSRSAKRSTRKPRKPSAKSSGTKEPPARKGAAKKSAKKNKAAANKAGRPKKAGRKSE